MAQTTGPLSNYIRCGIHYTPCREGVCSFPLTLRTHLPSGKLGSMTCMGEDVCLSVCLLVCLSVCLPVCLYLFFVSVCISLCLSVCLSHTHTHTHVQLFIYLFLFLFKGAFLLTVSFMMFFMVTSLFSIQIISNVSNSH